MSFRLAFRLPAKWCAPSSASPERNRRWSGCRRLGTATSKQAGHSPAALPFLDGRSMIEPDGLPAAPVDREEVEAHETGDDRRSPRPALPGVSACIRRPCSSPTPPPTRPPSGRASTDGPRRSIPAISMVPANCSAMMCSRALPARRTATRARSATGCARRSARTIASSAMPPNIHEVPISGDQAVVRLTWRLNVTARREDGDQHPRKAWTSSTASRTANGGIVRVIAFTNRDDDQ